MIQVQIPRILHSKRRQRQGAPPPSRGNEMNIDFLEFFLINEGENDYSLRNAFEWAKKMELMRTTYERNVCLNLESSHTHTQTQPKVLREFTCSRSSNERWYKYCTRRVEVLSAAKLMLKGTRQKAAWWKFILTRFKSVKETFKFLQWHQVVRLRVHESSAFPSKRFDAGRKSVMLQLTSRPKLKLLLHSSSPSSSN